MSTKNKSRKAATKKSVSRSVSEPPAVQHRDVEFLGWQETLSGDIFPLYNVFKKDHESYQSTVTEKTLQAQHLRTPKTPSPYPDVPPSPWHNLGIALDSPATAKEAMEGAGLNFTVVKKPLKEVLKMNYSGDVAGRWVTMRTDTGDILGIVGDRYEPVQNRDAFGFFDHLVGDGEAMYETAGAIGRGERIWILAKLPGYIRVRGKDLVSKYLLLSNSHDGSSLVQMKLTPIRVVCNNTLTAALKGSGEINIRHTVNAKADAEQALALLGLSNSLYEQLEVIFNRMALTKVSDKQVQDYLKGLIPDNEDENNAKNTAVRDACFKLYESGQGAELSRGTLWGAFNCVTEYTDHALEKNSLDRLESIWTGRGERMTRRAYQLAEALMHS